MEAAHTADYLVHLLFALEGHRRPYSSRLIYHLDKLDVQGWQPGELASILLDMISTGQPQRLQGVARRVTTMLHARGFRNVYDSWEGKIDACLVWVYQDEG